MRMKGYPAWFYPVLMTISTLLFATGCLLVPTALEMKLEWEMPWRLTGDLQIGMAAMHATVAFLVAATAGSLWGIHMRAGWRRRRNHHSGVGLILIMVLLGVTAIGIYYLADEPASLLVSVGHMGVGVAAPFLLVFHIVTARRMHGHQ